MTEAQETLFPNGLTLDDMSGIMLNENDLMQTIHESEFRSIWLPLFNPQPNEDGTPPPSPTQAWLAVSRSPYLPVRVLKEGGGEFIIPPLMRQVEINTDNQRFSFDRIIAITTETANAGHVGQAESTLMRYLRNVMRSKVSIDEAIESIRQWGEIFSRYEESLEQGKRMLELADRIVEFAKDPDAYIANMDKSTADGDVTVTTTENTMDDLEDEYTF